MNLDCKKSGPGAKKLDQKGLPILSMSPNQAPTTELLFDLGKNVLPNQQTQKQALTQCPAPLVQGHLLEQLFLVLGPIQCILFQ